MHGRALTRLTAAPLAQDPRFRAYDEEEDLRRMHYTLSESRAAALGKGDGPLARMRRQRPEGEGKEGAEPTPSRAEGAGAGSEAGATGSGEAGAVQEGKEGGLSSAEGSGLLAVHEVRARSTKGPPAGAASADGTFRSVRGARFGSVCRRCPTWCGKRRR